MKNTLHTMAKSMGKVPDCVKTWAVRVRGPSELPEMPCFTARSQEAAAQAEEIVSPVSWGLKTLEERKGALCDCRHCALSAQRCLRSFLICFYKGLLTSYVCAPFHAPSSIGHWLELLLSHSDSQGGGISMASHTD